MNSKFPLIQNRTDKSGKDKAGLKSPRPNTTKRDNDLRFSKIDNIPKGILRVQVRSKDIEVTNGGVRHSLV